MKAKKEENPVTRTINQLHFEDLDPIRFEELILAMAYKWRRWESINHFGKLGSDDGIDIEATENLYDRERMYIFQCKRYLKISQSQLKKIVDEFLSKNNLLPDVYVLVVSCSISKKNIEFMRTYLSSKGIEKLIVWDKSILETMLYTDYQNLLFAYFGINLIKEHNNKIKTIRRNVALKKKMHLDFLNNNNIGNYSVTEHLKKPFLKFGFTKMTIHSIYDKNYPYENTLLNNDYTGYFRVDIYDFYFNGLIVTDGFVEVKLTQLKNSKKISNKMKALRLGYIPFENIIEYDMEGDEFYSNPHLYCEFINVCDPFEKIGYAVLVSDDEYQIFDESETLKIEEIKFEKKGK